MNAWVGDVFGSMKTFFFLLYFSENPSEIEAIQNPPLFIISLPLIPLHFSFSSSLFISLLYPLSSSLSLCTSLIYPFIFHFLPPFISLPLSSSHFSLLYLHLLPSLSPSSSSPSSRFRKWSEPFCLRFRQAWNPLLQDARNGVLSSGERRNIFEVQKLQRNAKFY